MIIAACVPQYRPADKPAEVVIEAEDFSIEEPETPVEDRPAREVVETLDGFKDWQKENRDSLTYGDY